MHDYSCPNHNWSYWTMNLRVKPKVVFTLWHKLLQARAFLNLENIFLCFKRH
jgi:hypothetical protein